MALNNSWKDDNYKFVGQAFKLTYDKRMNELAPIMGKKNTTSVDYELKSNGGYGELPKYDGANLNHGDQFRGFKTIITPEEFSLTIGVKRKDALNDKSGACHQVGSDLADAAYMTVYAHALRRFGNAFNQNFKGGDEKPWAATDHPIASKSSEGRKWIADPDAGTFSNLITGELSVDSISDAFALAGRYVMPDGLPYRSRMNTLLVPVELEKVAQQICGQNSRLYPGEAADVNPYTSLHYIVMSGGRDGFTKKQWAICDPEMMKKVFKIVYNDEPQVVPGGGDNPLIDNYTGYTCFGIGWGDARPIVFSNPE